MRFELDSGLAIAIEDIQKSLDSIPYVEAKKLIEPLNNLILEATWMNQQRDEARKFDPQWRPPSYRLLFSRGKVNLNHSTAYKFGITAEFAESTSTVMLRNEVTNILKELNEELGSVLSVRLFKQAYGSETKTIIDNREELKAYVAEAVQSLNSQQPK